MNIIYVPYFLSCFPGGRYITDGPYSGELLGKIISEKLRYSLGEKFVIDFTGCRGIPSAFITGFFETLNKEGFNDIYINRYLTFCRGSEIWKGLEFQC